jgi:hypothetical protein
MPGRQRSSFSGAAQAHLLAELNARVTWTFLSSCPGAHQSPHPKNSLAANAVAPEREIRIGSHLSTKHFPKLVTKTLFIIRPYWTGNSGPKHSKQSQGFGP